MDPPFNRLTLRNRIPITGVRVVSPRANAPRAEDERGDAVSQNIQQELDTEKPSRAPSPHDTQTVELLATISDVLTEVDRRRENNLREMQEACLELSVAIAARLVWKEIDSDRLAVAELVAAAVDRMREHEAITVYLHPLDAAVWEKQTASDDTVRSTVRVVGDPEVPRGDCRAECDEFGLVRDIELELREMHEELLRGIEDVEVERRKNVSPNQGLKRFPDRRADS